MVVEKMEASGKYRWRCEVGGGRAERRENWGDGCWWRWKSEEDGRWVGGRLCSPLARPRFFAGKKLPFSIYFPCNFSLSSFYNFLFALQFFNPFSERRKEESRVLLGERRKKKLSSVLFSSLGFFSWLYTKHKLTASAETASNRVEIFYFLLLMKLNWLSLWRFLDEAKWADKIILMYLILHIQIILLYEIYKMRHIVHIQGSTSCDSHI